MLIQCGYQMFHHQTAHRGSYDGTNRADTNYLSVEQPIDVGVITNYDGQSTNSDGQSTNSDGQITNFDKQWYIIPNTSTMKGP